MKKKKRNNQLLCAAEGKNKMKEVVWRQKAHRCFVHLPGRGNVPVLGALGLTGVGLDLAGDFVV